MLNYCALKSDSVALPSYTILGYDVRVVLRDQFLEVGRNAVKWHPSSLITKTLLQQRGNEGCQNDG